MNDASDLTRCGKIVAELLSPAFNVAPPVLFNESWIPERPLASMKAAWEHKAFPERKIRLFEMNDIFVVDEGIVFDASGAVLSTFLTQQAPRHVDSARIKLAEAIERGSYITSTAPSVLCVKPGWQNYGHWLMELLPAADLAQRILRSADIEFIVMEENGPEMVAVVNDSLSLVGVDVNQVRRISREPRFYRRLFILWGMTRHGVYMSPLVFNPLDHVAKDIVPFGHDKVYVARSTLSSRYFHDNDRVEALFREHGYSILHPEKCSFTEQVAIFKGARTIAGIAGAGMANIAFCLPGTTVRLFYPSTMADTFFWFIAQHRGLIFEDVRVREIGRKLTHNAWDSELEFPLELAQSAL
jgi:hypothetical protein